MGCDVNNAVQPLIFIHDLLVNICAQNLL
jgi:hypothetical protein